MHPRGLKFTTALAWLSTAAAASVHGQGAEGSTMGPVAFLWPDDRPWDAAYDNTAPCGSTAGVSNRTNYPLSQGAVALSIADEAYNVAFYMAYDNDPDSQSDFTQQVVSNITEVAAGHQCYKIGSIPSTVKAGTNATIQLEYWANYEGENNGKNETFYACADITFVEAADFSESVPCFNVTSSDFTLGNDTTTASSSSSSEGLSTGAKAGIAVGTVIGSLAIVGVAAFVLLRNKKKTPSPEAPMTKQVSK